MIRRPHAYDLNTTVRDTTHRCSLGGHGTPRVKHAALWNDADKSSTHNTPPREHAKTEHWWSSPVEGSAPPNCIRYMGAAGWSLWMDRFAGV